MVLDWPFTVTEAVFSRDVELVEVVFGVEFPHAATNSTMKNRLAS